MAQSFKKLMVLNYNLELFHFESIFYVKNYIGMRTATNYISKTISANNRGKTIFEL